jgi:hypothetical protein
LFRLLALANCCNRYHWAFAIGPKTENKNSRGHLFHAKEKVLLVEGSSAPTRSWEFEERGTMMRPSVMQLVRVMVGKVKDREKLVAIMRRTPMRPQVPGWNCVGWIKEVLEEALKDPNLVGFPSGTSWQTVRDKVMWYVEDKKSMHRFDGKVEFDMERPATWDMIEGLETVP